MSFEGSPETLGTPGTPGTPGTTGTPGAKYGFVIDNRRCIGCHACTVACKAEHDVPIGVYRTWVKYVEKGEFPNTRRLFSVLRCNHCTDAPCVEICPVSCLHTRADGIVDFDGNRCIGCKSCMQACPYDALYINPETQTAAKCNYCAHRIDRGLEPACVNVCPVHAIISGDMNNPGSEIAQTLSRNQVTTRKPEKHTSPNLFYINGDDASLRPELAPPETNYYSSSQATGVGHYAFKAQDKPALSGSDEKAKVMGQVNNPSLHGDGSGVSARSSYDAPQKGVLWGWEVPAYLWTKSISTGIIFLPFLLQFMGVLSIPEKLEQILLLISLVFLGLTGALLVKDLDQPKRFLYVLLRPNWSSWLVRGAYIINVFGGLATLWLAHLFFVPGTGPEWLPPLVRGILVVVGVFAAIYTAFLFAQAKGRDFWGSPLLPFHMLVQSTMIGASAVILIGAAFGFDVRSILESVLAWMIVAHLGILLVEFNLPHVTGDTTRTQALITRGPFKGPFWSAVLLGNILPLGMLVFNPGGVMTLPAAVLVLAFALVIEHIWVRAPQLLPLR